jgi:integrase
MSVHRVRRDSGTAAFIVRWREGGHNRRRTFDLRRDAQLWESEVRRRRQLGSLRALDAGVESLDQYVSATWSYAHLPGLAPKTQQVYNQIYRRHVSPYLGSVALREITPETIKAWYGAMLRAGTGPEALHKAAILVGGILQLAMEGQRIQSNPARGVRKPRRPARIEVRPLAPERVEAMRAILSTRNAMVLSVLAYAGLRPQELRAMVWADVRENTLLIPGQKTGYGRTVRLLEHLRADLSAWREASGDPDDRTQVFPDNSGRQWSAEAFNKWGQHVFAGALPAAGIEHARPYDLRHSFASLLLHEGRSVIYVARQLGHGAALTMNTYGHVIDELENMPRMTADDAIGAARLAISSAAGSSPVPARTTTLPSQQ